MPAVTKQRVRYCNREKKSSPRTQSSPAPRTVRQHPQTAHTTAEYPFTAPAAGGGRRHVDVCIPLQRYIPTSRRLDGCNSKRTNDDVRTPESREGGAFLSQQCQASHGNVGSGRGAVPPDSWGECNNLSNLTCGHNVALVSLVFFSPSSWRQGGRASRRADPSAPVQGSLVSAVWIASLSSALAG